MLNINEDHVLETGADHFLDQNGIVGHIRDVMNTGDHHMAVITDQDVVDRLYRAMEVSESIRANVIVLLVQMNQGVLNTDTGDEICSGQKINF